VKIGGQEVAAGNRQRTAPRVDLSAAHISPFAITVVTTAAQPGRTMTGDLVDTCRKVVTVAKISSNSNAKIFNPRS